MLREGGITAGGDGGEAGLVIQSAAVDGGGDMIFHCRREGCGVESGRRLGGSRGEFSTRPRGSASRFQNESLCTRRCSTADEQRGCVKNLKYRF